MWDLIVNLWNTLIFEPIFNLLAVLMAIIPGHNLGVALLILIILIRLAIYPIIKKQLIQLKKQRDLQPEIAKIKQANKGNRQKEAFETLALYREHSFNPFAVLGYLLLQIPIFICIYQIARQISSQNLLEHAYTFVKDLSWMQDLAINPEIFDPTFLSLVDLTRQPLETGGLYIAGFIVLLLGAISQYFISKQMSAQTADTSKPQKTLRQIFKASAAGQKLDQTEINASVSRSMRFVLPGLFLIVGLRFYTALSFFWLTSSLMQYWQFNQFNQKQEQNKTTAQVNGQTVDGFVSKTLNAKEKKQRQFNQTKNSKTGRKRVSATAKTVKKSKNNPRRKS
ncbi:MAG: membrane protein insertase YidC [Candidatus Saccharibacteria bacterium]|nr:membrane protein insertase YidC [Candidatus Saccharibacteria bacterium]MCY4088811.1 membrane protein insertase YidC [Candidatus Saccharibacteria bacterium]